MKDFVEISQYQKCFKDDKGLHFINKKKEEVFLIETKNLEYFRTQWIDIKLWSKTSLSQHHDVFLKFHCSGKPFGLGLVVEIWMNTFFIGFYSSLADWTKENDCKIKVLSWYGYQEILDLLDDKIKKGGEIFMNKAIANVIEKTKDAILVDKYFGKDIPETAFGEMLLKGKEVELVEKAKELEKS